MLILTRRVGEGLKIGDEVTVTVLRVKGDQVRLGIEAPNSIAVHREELSERLEREASEATSDTLPATAEVEAIGH
jgi:carbon storage regulator